MDLATIIARTRVIATAAVTWLVVIAAVLQELVAEVANSEIDGDAAELIVSWGGRALILIGGAVTIIRRVTPVDTDDRGVLPQ